MRPCIHIVDILDSINTLQTSQLSMSSCTDVSVILQYLAPIIAYHILVKQRKLNVQLQSIRSSEPTSIRNISSTSCLYTETFNDQYIHGSLLHISFFGNMGLRKKHHHSRYHEVPVADREERLATHVCNTIEKIMLVSCVETKTIRTQKPFSRWRYSKLNVLKIIVINKTRRILGIRKVLARPKPDNFTTTSGRCFKCVEAAVGNKSCKAEREKLNHKLKTKCSKCQKFVCKKDQTELHWVEIASITKYCYRFIY